MALQPAPRCADHRPMVLADGLSRHAVHIVIFGVPVLVLSAAVAWQELRARLTGRSGSRSTPDARAGVGSTAPEWCWLATSGLVVAGAIHAIVSPEHFR